MTMYVCYNCGKRIEIKTLGVELFCPNCSGKILFKETPPTSKEVSAD